jgi:23S rRNA G2069 N7-methylase RlmK/C1962 C5-methylase RlmI
VLPLKVRLPSFVIPSYTIGDIVGKRLDAALALRASCGLPSEETSCYRLIHAEGDRLSGLVVDVYGDMAVVASSALWVRVCIWTM